MNITEFKRILKKTGVTFEKVDRAFKKQKLSIRKIICRSSSFEQVIHELCWYEAKEGFDFWHSVYSHRSPPVSQLAKIGEVVDGYTIDKCINDDWAVGCRRIDREQRMKLLKLLADDLGYEVEE